MSICHQVFLVIFFIVPFAEAPLVCTVPHTRATDRKPLRNAQDQDTTAGSGGSMSWRDAAASTAVNGTARAEFTQSAQPITNKPAPIKVEDWAA